MGIVLGMLFGFFDFVCLVVLGFVVLVFYLTLLCGCFIGLPGWVVLLLGYSFYTLVVWGGLFDLLVVLVFVCIVFWN